MVEVDKRQDVYNIGMTGRSLSLATAIGILKSIVSVTLLAIVNFVSKKTRGAVSYTHLLQSCIMRT